MLAFMENYDVLICPTTAGPAIPHLDLSTVTLALGALSSYAFMFNLTGWPGAVVRYGTSPEGLPIGVQVVAKPWLEGVALAVAQHLKDTLGGWKRPPI